MENNTQGTTSDKFNPNNLNILDVFLILKFLEISFLLYLNFRQKKVIDVSRHPPNQLSTYMSRPLYEYSRARATQGLSASTFAILFDFLILIVFYGFSGPHLIWKFCKRSFISNEWRIIAFITSIVTMRNFKLYLINKLTSVLMEDQAMTMITQKSRIELIAKRFLLDLSFLLTTDLVFNRSLYGTTNFFIGIIFLETLTRSILDELFSLMFSKEGRTSFPDGEIRDKIEDMTNAYNYPRHKLLSTHSCHVEGSFPGLESQPIPVNKVLEGYYMEDQGGGHAKTFEIQEVLAFLAHEICHWTYWHRLKSRILQQMICAIKVLLSVKLLEEKEIFSSFSIDDQIPMIGFFLTYYCVLENLSNTIGWFERWIFRSHEYEADTFVRLIGKGNQLKTGLLKMNVRSFLFPYLDPLFSSYHLSLPSPLERVEALDSPFRIRIFMRHRINKY